MKGFICKQPFRKPTAPGEAYYPGDVLAQEDVEAMRDKTIARLLRLGLMERYPQDAQADQDDPEDAADNLAPMLPSEAADGDHSEPEEA